MKFTITYCGMWNYRPQAAGLADELKRKFGAEATLIESRGGVFEVEVDGRLIFSKKQLDRFPENGEIETLVKARRMKE